MKRTDFYKKINRNSNSIFNHIYPSPRLVPNSDVHLDMWADNDDVTTGVQIIELNSSDNPQTSPDEETESLGHLFSYGDHDVSHENGVIYKANKPARERRRISSQDQYHCTINEYDNSFPYTENCGTGNTDIDRENVVLNHQMNCFTIIDKHFLINSDNSSDNECGNIDEIQCDDQMQYNENDNENIIAYESNYDREKRTIWIYSFKNKRLLSDDDFELVNIPSRDATSSSCSIEDVDEHKPASYTRVATPIPSSFVPRLNLTLTSTLPTVTEVTEPQKQSSSNQTEKSSKDNTAIKQKRLNNWFMSENATPSNDYIDKLNKHTSVINWLALSPREKRRRFVNANATVELATVREASTSFEDKCLNRDQSFESRRNVVSKIRATVEQSNSTRRTDRTLTHRSGESVFKRVDISMDAAIETDIEDCPPEDRGDHNKSSKRIKRPQIRFSPKPVLNTSLISEPIEKLDGDNWIMEDKVKLNNFDYYYQTENIAARRAEIHGDCAGNTLLIRNMSLLKPAHWAEYLPITDSLPSLHLSISSGSEVETQSWCRRLLKMFRCCK